MQLDNNYLIVRDPHSWNLESLKNWRHTQYHPNLKQALLAYVQLCIEPPITVQHLLKAISEVEQRIAQMVANLDLRKWQHRDARRSKMRLDDDYRITHDARSWNLVSMKNRNNTQFHPTLKQVLLAYLHLRIEPPITVQHLLEAISDVEKRITQMIAGLGLESGPKLCGKEEERDV